jgi:alpha-N-arabinofuranosidase
VRTVASAPGVTYDRVGGKGNVRGVSASASLKDRTLTLTLVNPRASEPLPVEIAVRGASAADVRARVLAAADVHAHNTFDRPDAVGPRDERVGPMRDGVIALTLAPASVTRLTLTG